MASEARKPLIFEIKGNSWEDGPGIRSVIFLKGCPLDCLWCQNPESKKVTPELWWEPKQCVKDGACMEVCPQAAISPEFEFFVDRERCTSCFRCADVCTAQALAPSGRAIEIDQIVRDTVRYRSFFDSTGGGVTLSGGEATLHMEFISALLQRFKQEKIHTLLQTSGFFSLKRFESLVMPHLDIIHYDIKLIDPEQHKRYCGVSNEKILKNFIALHNRPNKSFQLKPRTPLIPGITDTDDNLRGIADFYETQQVRKAVLQLNNPVWLDKFIHLGKVPTPELREQLGKFYDNDKSLQIKETFKKRGIEITFE